MAENNIIKKPYQNDIITPENEEEIKKCMEDVVYFAKNYVMITHPVKGRQLFEPWPYQIEMLRSFQKERYNVCLTSRQMGKCLSFSTIITLKSPSGQIKKTTIGEFFQYNKNNLKKN